VRQVGYLQELNRDARPAKHTTLLLFNIFHQIIRLINDASYFLFSNISLFNLCMNELNNKIFLDDSNNM